MHPEYDGVKYYSENDLSLGYYLEKATRVLDSFDTERHYTNINEIIELHNIYLIFSSNRIKTEYLEKYSPTIEKLAPIIGRYFNSIDDKSLIKEYKNVSCEYIDSFWDLFDKFQLYKRVSESTFRELISDPTITLYKILEHKAVVDHYDKELAGILRKSEQTARIITGEFLEKKQQNHRRIYIPKSLKPSEFEMILGKYIDSPDAHVGVMQLLATSQSSAECPISDSLRLKAMKKAEAYWERGNYQTISIGGEIGVCFKDAEDIVKVDNSEQHKWYFTYDTKWIRDNLDYPTLLNNFIYLFEYTDLCFRCTFPSIKSRLGIFEKDFGVKGKREYIKGAVFNALDMKSLVEMRGYSEILSHNGVRIENLFQWFFKDYLKDEFNTEGFVINMPSRETTWLERCKLLPSEMEGVLKQFALYVENGEIDRELYEISSNPLKYENIPSLHAKKYIYAKSDAIIKEQHLFFSNQSMLHYIHDEKKAYKSFVDLLLSRNVSLSDYGVWMHESIFWLKERGAISINDSGVIAANWSRVMLLKDLYDHEVICSYYYSDNIEINNLVASGDLEYGSTLFSIPEQQYLNYILNKAEYSNGLDLRNKYSHSSYPLDEKQQIHDYIILLRTMAVIVIKINEEFCLKYPKL